MEHAVIPLISNLMRDHVAGALAEDPTFDAKPVESPGRWHAVRRFVAVQLHDLAHRIQPEPQVLPTPKLSQITR